MVASQGFSEAFLPQNMLQKRLPKNRSWAPPVMNAAMEMNRCTLINGSRKLSMNSE